jgi:triacylglycerol lipase
MRIRNMKTALMALAALAVLGPGACGGGGVGMLGEVDWPDLAVGAETQEATSKDTGSATDSSPLEGEVGGGAEAGTGADSLAETEAGTGTETVTVTETVTETGTVCAGALPGDWVLQSEPEFRPALWAWSGYLESACHPHGFLVAGARDMQVTITLKGSYGLAPRLLVADVATASGRRPGTLYSDQSTRNTSETLSFSFGLPYSGEFLVLVGSAPDPDGSTPAASGSYQLTARCTGQCDGRFTRHPVVLLHGMAGWDSILNFYEYFLNVKDDLIDLGYDVHSTQVSWLNDTDYRAAELEGQLMEILAQTGARTLDLVAHSQGGLDARHFISVMGHAGDVSILAMVATPNRGTITADKVLDTVGGGLAKDVIAGVVDFVGSLIGGDQVDAEHALSLVSTAYMADVFNPSHPDDPGVAYWSWAGVTCTDTDFDCQDAHGGEYAFPALGLIYRIMDSCDAATIGCGPSDGMVPLNSAPWGEFQGVINADHMDEIGQFVTGPFDHKAFYREVVAKIHAEGY